MKNSPKKIALCVVAGAIIVCAIIVSVCFAYEIFPDQQNVQDENVPEFSHPLSSLSAESSDTNSSSESSSSAASNDAADSQQRAADPQEASGGYQYIEEGGGNQGGGSSGPANITVTVSIDGSNGGLGASSYTVTLPDGSSAYDALVNTGVSVGGSGSYVSSINGLAEFAKGPGSGWIYYVDGIKPGFSSSSYKLHGGEYIRWVYSLDFGNDV